MGFFADDLGKQLVGGIVGGVHDLDGEGTQLGAGCDQAFDGWRVLACRIWR